VETEAGSQNLTYDHLVYALGSAVESDSVPGVSQYAYSMTPQGPRSAETLREVLPALAKTGGRVVVAGGGLTGIECAAQIKGVYPALQVSIVTEGDCGVFPSRDVQDYMRDSLRRQDVQVYENRQVTALTAHELRLADGSAMPYDVCVWAAGFHGLPLAAEAGIATNERGRILVDPYLRSVSFPDIFAVGDAALPTGPIGAPPRMSAVFALTTGAHVGDNLSRTINGKPQKPFGFSTFGQAVALGPDNAIGFNTFPNDRPVWPRFRGKFAANLRSFFASLLMFLFVMERRVPGSFFWFGKNRHVPVSAASPLKAKSQQTA
ncbi:MAG TPA: FAD-dependent oxidoreductase, partial [Aggregatilineales bacterium]|nr:FAD-dependent oxidoreductase [Aggregatilineales bacterium]